jgi:hypothetical protein
MQKELRINGMYYNISDFDDIHFMENKKMLKYLVKIMVLLE